MQDIIHGPHLNIQELVPRLDQGSQKALHFSVASGHLHGYTVDILLGAHQLVDAMLVNTLIGPPDLTHH